MGCYGRCHADQLYSQFLRERVSVSPPLQLRTPMYAYIHTAHFADGSTYVHLGAKIYIHASNE